MSPGRAASGAAALRTAAAAAAAAACSTVALLAEVAGVGTRDAGCLSPLRGLAEMREHARALAFALPELREILHVVAVLCNGCREHYPGPPALAHDCLGRARRDFHACDARFFAGPGALGRHPVHIRHLQRRSSDLKGDGGAVCHLALGGVHGVLPGGALHATATKAAKSFEKAQF
jgi:hypothetical protein